MIHVFYHSNCYDGFGAAYVCWKKFGNGAKYHPVSYGYPPPEKDKDGVLILGGTLYIVDFSYSKDVLIKLRERFQNIIVLDHHKTAKEELSHFLEVTYQGLEVHFDMKRSGALMTWNYLFPKKYPPQLIRHISDRDLWKFELHGTAFIHKALVSYPKTFALWDQFDLEVLKKEGVTCERLYSQLVENICENPWMKEIDGQEVPVVNTSIAWSEIGAQLLVNNPDAPFVASFTVFEDQVMWSLRSRKGSDVDVSAIAKKFGGGGHKHAAGFKAQRF